MRFTRKLSTHANCVMVNSHTEVILGSMFCLFMKMSNIIVTSVIKCAMIRVA